MKDIADLTNAEVNALLASQERLKYAAMRFAQSTFDDHASKPLRDLFIAARQFSVVCHEIGFNEFSKTDDFGITPIPDAPAGQGGHGPRL